VIDPFLDPWEAIYLDRLEGAGYLPWSDELAYKMFPNLNFIYDKLQLSQLVQGPRTWDLSFEIPDLYPCIVKPRTNFYGLSKDAYVVYSADEIYHKENFIAQEFIEGIHFSTDYVLQNGKILDFSTFIGYKNYYGDFTSFERNPFPDKVADAIEHLMMPFNYTGVLNVESIGGKIIEAHLRSSLQFFDIDGGLQKQLPDFLKSRTYSRVRYKPSVSKVLRVPYDGDLIVHELPSMPSTVSSIQITHNKGTSLSSTDPGGVFKRYAVINGFSLKDVNEYAILLRNHIEIKR
jgi:hypothetical protein